MLTAPAPPRPNVMNLPNALTTARLGLAFVLFWLIAVEWWYAALGVFIVAAITDWLDGFLARKQGLTSAFGRNFDPLVDKVLVCGAFIFLLPVKPAGLEAWMVTLIASREIVITGLRGFMESQGANFGADWLGKIKMVLQCATLIAIFLVLALRDTGDSEMLRLCDPLRVGLIWAMLAATALSGAQYLWRAAVILRNT